MPSPHPHDIDLLPGSAGAVRRSASTVRGTVGELATARRAAEQLEAVCGGEHWRGEAFDAFGDLVTRQPLTTAIDRATAAMHEAADRLDWYADRFDEHQAELVWCRRRLGEVHQAAEAERAAAEAAGLSPPGPSPEIVRILRRVDEIWRGHRATVDAVAQTFDRLDDRPLFATPPPSNFERVTGAVGSFVDGLLDGAWSFAVGVAEGVRELVVGLVEVAALLNPVTLPARILDLIENWDQVVAVLRYAWEEPGDFFGELGKAMLDWEMLLDDPARWVGRRIPDILLTVTTAGMGKVGTTAARSARFLRGGALADRTVSRVGLVRPLAVHRPTSVAEAMAPGRSVFGRLASIGQDVSRSDQSSAIGALHRTDTVAGRVAASFDDLLPRAEVVRQVPGLVNDEIRGFTSVPRRMLADHVTDARVTNLLDSTAVASAIDNKLSGGLTSTLGMVDGLLVGAPAMSPQLHRAMAGVLGVHTLDQLAQVHGFVGQVDAAASPRTAQAS